MFPDFFRDDVFTLETRRLFLRWPKASDAAEVEHLAGERRVAEMTSRIPHPYPPAAATVFILAARDSNAAGATVRLAITDRRDPNRLLGMIGLQARSADCSHELGYWLGIPYWGRGFMTEAAQAVIDSAFLYSEAKAIAASVRVTNPASRRVLERCGFQFAGSNMATRPAWGDTVSVDHYRLSRGNWASLKGWRAPLPAGRETLRESA